MGELYTKVKAMNKTVYEEGLEKGFEKGFEKGLEEGREIARLESLERIRQAFLPILEARFGSIPEGVPEKVKTLSWDEIRRLIVACQKVTAIEDLGLI
jgi:flagellar biosynthesis/type III secretory pathway protein FliH